MSLKRGKILIVLVFILLAACKLTEEELKESYKSSILIKLEAPEEIASDEEFNIRFEVTNNLAFPITLSSLDFQFSDLEFLTEGTASSRIYPDASILPEETRVFEQRAVRNSEASLGSGIITSLVGLNLGVEDPKYGYKEIAIRKDFAFEVV